jgi:ferredoxin
MSSSLGDSSLLVAAQAAAMSAAAAIPAAEPEWITFVSRGVVLVAGANARAMAALARLPPPLRVVAFVPDAPTGAVAPRNVRLVGAPILSLTGYLGCFTATTVPVKGEPVDAGRFGYNEDRRFDLVLDLNDPPLLRHEVRPYGYFAPRTEAELDAALTQIRAQPTTWRKPRYFDYRTDLCAHAASGVAGCTRCLDVCPTGAIASAGNKLEFDPHLCQGCGTCTAVCPEGAVRYAHPPADTALERLHAALAAWTATGAAAPRLIASVTLSSTKANAAPHVNSPRDLPYAVPALASFGIEAWFAALALGAAQVVLIADATAAQASIHALRRELQIAQSILSALSETPDRIVLTTEADAIPAVPLERVCPVAGPLAGPTKRTVLYAALDHLNGWKSRSTQTVPLAPQAPFGTVTVSKDRCTLCFACVNLCPTQALTIAAGSRSELRFAEARCVQCGLCRNGCPEQAIALRPQVQLDRAARERPTTLCVDEPFPCVRCGTGFISRRMLARSLELMKDHPQLIEHGSERLKLCPACRAQATLLDLPVDTC